MPRREEEELTLWMASHAAVSMMTDDAAWLIEDALIAEGPALPLRIASGMELGGEAAARSAKRLGLLCPLFMPTAQ